MSAVGIYGGTFDPVHNGHLITAQKVLELRKLDKIIFIPANISPFKQEAESASPDHRMNMLKLSLEGNDRFECSDIEINAGGVSYSIDTLKVLKTKFDKLELIIGFDNLLDFPDWRQPDEIVRIATLVVLERLKFGKRNIRNRFFDLAVFADTPLINISSTDIRDRVNKGLSINNLVPKQVIEYIYKNNLYKE